MSHQFTEWQQNPKTDYGMSLIPPDICQSLSDVCQSLSDTFK